MVDLTQSEFTAVGPETRRWSLPAGRESGECEATLESPGAARLRASESRQVGPSTSVKQGRLSRQASIGCRLPRHIRNSGQASWGHGFQASRGARAVGAAVGEEVRRPGRGRRSGRPGESGAGGRGRLGRPGDSGHGGEVGRSGTGGSPGAGGPGTRQGVGCLGGAYIPGIIFLVTLTPSSVCHFEYFHRKSHALGPHS